MPSYRHISPLHQQAAQSRQIIANENPGLHLIFHYDRIFIKPTPAYFLSASFWTFLRNADQTIYRAAIGFVRSYNYHIRYELDYDIACEKKLIPCDSEGQRDTDSKLLVQGLHVESYPTYAEFCRFIKQFHRVSNAGVSRRYHYGELRLQRLDLLAFLRKGMLAYFHLTRGWSVYIHSFLAPIILILGEASVILSAMQVNLNSQEMLKSSGEWLPLVKASLCFPVVIIILVTVVAGVIMLSALVVTLQDSLRARWLMRHGKGGII